MSVQQNYSLNEYWNKQNNNNNNQSILEGLIRAMPQLTERNQLM